MRGTLSKSTKAASRCPFAEVFGGGVYQTEVFHSQEATRMLDDIVDVAAVGLPVQRQNGSNIEHLSSQLAAYGKP